MRHVFLLIQVGLLFFTCVDLQAQADGLVAYVPEKPVARTADDTRIRLVAGAVAGKVEALIPEDAVQVDILNARGNVKRSYGSGDLGELALGDLRPGTWTLRVHTSTSMLLVRRFVVMQRGAVVWSPTGPIRKR